MGGMATRRRQTAEVAVSVTVVDPSEPCEGMTVLVRF